MNIENMDFALNYRMGLASTDALSDFDACVWPLLQALGWRGLPRQVAEALPHMDQALDLLPADYWRWYLTAYGPEGSDSQFTWDHFQSSVNKDLADVLGNFVNRILKFGASRFEGVIPEGGTPGEAEAWLETEVATRLANIASHYEAMEFRKAAAETRALWAAGNEYLTRAEPWVHFKTDKDQAALGGMRQHEVGRQRIVGWPDFELQCSPHPAAQVGQGDVPAPAAHHQQQRDATLLRAVPAVEDRGLIKRFGIVDRLPRLLRGEPAREQRLARARRPMEDGGAERPAGRRRQRFDHCAIARSDHDRGRLAGAGRNQRKSDLRGHRPRISG